MSEEADKLSKEWSDYLVVDVKNDVSLVGEIPILIF